MIFRELPYPPRPTADLWRLRHCWRHAQGRLNLDEIIGEIIQSVGRMVLRLARKTHCSGLCNAACSCGRSNFGVAQSSCLPACMGTPLTAFMSQPTQHAEIASLLHRRKGVDFLQMRIIHFHAEGVFHRRKIAYCQPKQLFDCATLNPCAG